MLARCLCGVVVAPAPPVSFRRARFDAAGEHQRPLGDVVVATEIDLDSTYVGGSEACIEELLANSELEVARLDVAAGVTADSDTLNPAAAPGLPR